MDTDKLFSGMAEFSARMDTDKLFSGMAEFSAKMNRAETRCREIAQQEDLLGYADSAKTYFDMRGEIFCSRVWITETLGYELYGDGDW